MDIAVNFDHNRGGWVVHSMTADVRTRIGPWLFLRQQETMLRLFRYVGAGESAITDAEQCIRSWGCGTVHIALAAGRRNLLRLCAPWCDGLTPL